MPQISEFKLPSGDVVLIEADDPPIRGGQVRAGIGDALSKLTRRGDDQQPAALEERMHPLVQALVVIREAVSIVVAEPQASSAEVSAEGQEIVLQAGLKFVGEAGIVLCKAVTEASISITLKWKQGVARLEG
jgi:Trypsin-co-occurring domain 1